MDKNNIKIKVGNKEYGIVFNLNVMEQIQEEYGTIEKWANMTDCEEPKATPIIFSFWCMMNEAIDIENEEHEGEEGYPRKELTKKQVGRIITEYGLINATKDLQKTVVESTKSDEKN